MPSEILERGSRCWKLDGKSPNCSLLVRWRSDNGIPNRACLAPCMPAGTLSERQHKGLLGPKGLPEKYGNGNFPSGEKSGGWGIRNFFLGGEKGDK